METTKYVITYDMIDLKETHIIKGQATMLCLEEAEVMNRDNLEANRIHIANMILNVIKLGEKGNRFKPSTIQCKLTFESGEEFELPQEIIMARLDANQALWQD